MKSAGFDNYLIKPVKQSRLFDCLVASPPDAPLLDAVLRPEGVCRSRALCASHSPLRKPRILLAEDNHINQLIGVGLLRKLGYETDIAANGLQALDALKSNRYDIIFMDCQMPEMDGYEAARTIRAREQSPDL